MYVQLPLNLGNFPLYGNHDYRDLFFPLSWEWKEFYLVDIDLPTQAVHFTLWIHFVIRPINIPYSNGHYSWMITMFS